MKHQTAAREWPIDGGRENASPIADTEWPTLLFSSSHLQNRTKKEFKTKKIKTTNYWPTKIRDETTERSSFPYKRPLNIQMKCKWITISVECCILYCSVVAERAQNEKQWKQILCAAVALIGLDGSRSWWAELFGGVCGGSRSPICRTPYLPAAANLFFVCVCILLLVIERRTRSEAEKSQLI